MRELEAPAEGPPTVEPAEAAEAAHETHAHEAHGHEGHGLESMRIKRRFLGMMIESTGLARLGLCLNHRHGLAGNDRNNGLGLSDLFNLFNRFNCFNNWRCNFYYLCCWRDLRRGLHMCGFHMRSFHRRGLDFRLG